MDYSCPMIGLMEPMLKLVLKYWLKVFLSCTEYVIENIKNKLFQELVKPPNFV